MEKLLKLENVSYSYRDGKEKNKILEHVSYSFEKGKIYAVVGASGSGKTTTLSLSSGLDKPDEGKVLFKGKDIQEIGLNKYRREDISIVFQSYNLIYYMNALENVMSALEIAGIKRKDKKEYWAAQESDITGVIPQEVFFEDEEVYKEVHKVLCMGDKEDIAALEQQLVKEFPQIRIYRSKDTYLEIMSMKASKSDAIHMLKDHFHVKQEEIMAFGDNFNDIDMIRYAGLGVAMGNAADEVKEVADIVTDINDNEGERQILDKYFR